MSINKNTQDGNAASYTSEYDSTKGKDVYTLSDFGQATAFHVTISGVEKTAVMTVQAEKGQIFDTIHNEDVLNISRDSAFTVQYTVSNYQAAEYAGMQLVFGNSLPQDTNLIMMTTDGAGKPEYWYYPVTASTVSVIQLGFLISSMGFQLWLTSFRPSGTR